MAIFTNQATLTYNGNTTNSNIAYGEILEALTATKTAIEDRYAPGGLVTYVVTLRNTANRALNGLTVTDDLGTYAFGGVTVYPLTYEAGTAALFVNGILQAAPAVTAGPPLVFTGINIPANGDAVLIYQARANNFADPAADGRIDNTVTVTYNGAAWTEGVQYEYNEATGLFTTNIGNITVPAATYTQDPATGEFTLTPGIATLVVTGTI
jgi:uncharacterized repeat protein (TIGR01451 family)